MKTGRLQQPQQEPLEDTASAEDGMSTIWQPEAHGSCPDAGTRFAAAEDSQTAMMQAAHAAAAAGPLECRS